jgi:hypothetical protein
MDGFMGMCTALARCDRDRCNDNNANLGLIGINWNNDP